METEMLKRHEKFIAFLLIGAALMTLAIMIYVKPTPENSVAVQMLNMIIGAFIGAFGAATQVLLKVNTPGDNKVTVDNAETDPVPTTTAPDKSAPAALGELPESEKL
jgi:hypothetical protein